MSLLRRLFRNEVTGSWFGFPNPRYMSRGLFVEELSFRLFMIGTLFVGITVVMLAVSFFTSVLMVSSWPIVTAIACACIAVVLNLVAIFLPMFFK